VNRGLQNGHLARGEQVVKTNIGYAKMNGISTYGKTLPGHHLDVLMMSMDKTAGNTDKTKMLLPMCDWMKTTTANVK
jgi:hypothetical protein